MAGSASSLKHKLDWSKLLGFNQAERRIDESSVQRLTDPRMAKLGGKGCIKFGAKAAS